MKARRYDLLAALLAYPAEDYPAALNRCMLALDSRDGGAGQILAPLREKTQEMSVAEIQEMYTRTFDINPVCTLEVGWHIYGEDYARGALLVKMREMLREHKLTESQELPDHLTHVLALLGRLEGEEAAQLAGRYALPALEKMLDGMDGAEFPYRALLEAVSAVIRQDHDVEPVAPRERRGDPPDWNRRLPMVGGLNKELSGRRGPDSSRTHGRRGSHELR